MTRRKIESFNSISHMIGAAASVLGLIAVVVSASRQGDPWKIVSASVYGATLVLLYTCSAIYHGLSGRKKKVFRILDYEAIYLLIAGTYTPFTLVTLRGAWGWSLFGIVWGLAIAGIMVDSLPQKGRRLLPLIIYLVMGWLMLAAIGPLFSALPAWGLIWLVAGGVFYTSGVGFFVLDEKFPHFHGIWHLFVLAGSVCHYLAVFFYVIN